MNAVETVYRAMGWRPALWNGRYWHEPGAPEEAVAYPLPDPLADTPEGWWEFGQILGWAEEWATGKHYRLDWALGWEPFEGKERRTWYATITHLNTIIANTSASDFRTAVLSALAEAVGGQG